MRIGRGAGCCGGAAMLLRLFCYARAEQEPARPGSHLLVPIRFGSWDSSPFPQIGRAARNPNVIAQRQRTRRTRGRRFSGPSRPLVPSWPCDRIVRRRGSMRRPEARRADAGRRADDRAHPLEMKGAMGGTSRRGERRRRSRSGYRAARGPARRPYGRRRGGGAGPGQQWKARTGTSPHAVRVAPDRAARAPDGCFQQGVRSTDDERLSVSRQRQQPPVPVWAVVA